MTTRPISDVLALALEDYQEAAERSPKTMAGCGYPYMCSILVELLSDDRITYDEEQLLSSMIRGWIDSHFSLRVYLKRNGQPHDYAARLRFYEDKLDELKTLEKNHEYFR